MHVQHHQDSGLLGRSDHGLEDVASRLALIAEYASVVHAMHACFACDTQSLRYLAFPTQNMMETSTYSGVIGGVAQVNCRDTGWLRS